MRFVWIISYLFVALVIEPGTSIATTRYVSPGGSNTTDCTTTINPCNISWAITSAAPGDTLAVAEGTYTETLTINESITIEGGYSSSFLSRQIFPDPSDTVIDGQENDRPITISGGSEVSVVLDGIRITNGDAADALFKTYSGGGLLVANGATATLINVLVDNNFANSAGGNGNGGGIAVTSDSSLIIRQSIIENNASTAGNGSNSPGGGVHFHGKGNITITNSFLVDNLSGNPSLSFHANGAQLYIDISSIGSSNALVQHTTIASVSGKAAAFVFSGSNDDALELKNSIIANHPVGFITTNISSPSITLSNNLFSNNATEVSDLGGDINSEINSFTGDADFINPASGDYHIGSNSDAIDMGASSSIATDIDNESRPRGNAPDIGADETSFIGDSSSSSSSSSSGGGGDNNEQINSDGTCATGVDCIYQSLSSTACAGVNGFLDQINIASVLNLQTLPLDVVVEYRDGGGKVQGMVQATIESNLKQDFIINDLGLIPDTVGSVCIISDASASGAWSGGVSLYKSNTRLGPINFGTDFDYALFYPFTNPTMGETTLPLNTFHLGVNPDSTVANWISIADATPGDGEGLSGILRYFSSLGEELGTENVSIPDGGRSDFAGHTGVSGPENKDAIGMVRFIPNKNSDGGEAQYYATLTRYFYDCFQASCNNFHTAFVIPSRPPTDIALNGGTSTVDGEISIIELNNIGDKATSVEVSIYNVSGNSSGNTSRSVEPLGTQHVIIDEFIGTEQISNSMVKASSGTTVSALSLFYKLNEFGVLQYAYAAPFVKSPAAAHLSQFNSFISHQNIAEVVNTTGNTINGTVTVLDFEGKPLLPDKSVTLQAFATDRFILEVPQDTYGTIIIQADTAGLVFRNYTERSGQYKLAFPSQ